MKCSRSLQMKSDLKFKQRLERWLYDTLTKAGCIGSVLTATVTIRIITHLTEHHQAVRTAQCVWLLMFSAVLTR